MAAGDARGAGAAVTCAQNDAHPKPRHHALGRASGSQRAQPGACGGSPHIRPGAAAAATPRLCWVPLLVKGLGVKSSKCRGSKTAKWIKVSVLGTPHKVTGEVLP